MRAELVLCLIAAWFISGCAIHHVESFPRGGKRAEGELFCGKQVGKWTYYYSNGQKEAQGFYKDDVPDGHWTHWNVSGQVVSEGEFAGERRTGIWNYWRENGKLLAHGRFDKGKKTGLWRFYYDDGELAVEGDFLAGERTLQWRIRHDSGKPWGQGFYFRGKRDGMWTFSNEKGDYFEKVYEYSEGLKNSEDLKLVREDWPSFGGESTKRRVGFVVAGKQEGRWVLWHRNGSRRLEGDFAEGLATGKWVAWDREGDHYAEGTVEGDRLGEDWKQWFDAFRPPADSVEETVKNWIAELHSGSESWVSLEAGTSGYESPPEALVEEVDERVKALVNEPVPPQPQFTVGERKDSDDILRAYTTGSSQRSRVVGDRSNYIPPADDYWTGRGNREKAAWLKTKSLPVTSFTATDGNTVNLQDYRGTGKRVMLVILRGYAGQVCVYCAKQTEALAPYYQKFDHLNTEVFLVYPGPPKGVDALKKIYRETLRKDFPPRAKVLYDVDLELVKKLTIENDTISPLAWPTTLILDETGRIEYAYVGESREDRPPFKRVIESLEELLGLRRTTDSSIGGQMSVTLESKSPNSNYLSSHRRFPHVHR